MCKCVLCPPTASPTAREDDTGSIPLASRSAQNDTEQIVQIATADSLPDGDDGTISENGKGKMPHYKRDQEGEGLILLQVSADCGWPPAIQLT